MRTLIVTGATAVALALLPPLALAQAPESNAQPQSVQPAPSAASAPSPSQTAETSAVLPSVALEGAASPSGNDGAGPAINAMLPHNLSPWSMFLAADVVVKAVMVGLILASILSWTIWLAKTVELVRARSALRKSMAALLKCHSVSEAHHSIGPRFGLAAELTDAAKTEMDLSQELSNKAGIKERLGSRIDGIISGAARSLNRGTGILATVGAMAPFVGLFGTVWGIMNSFISISNAQTTNLAVVAPGIAEALLATAIGLVAAIPAVMFYNILARKISACKAEAGAFGAELERLVSRELDRGRTHVLARAAE